MSSVRDALAEAADLQGLSDTGRRDSELLLAEVLGLDRAALFAWPERELDTEQQRKYREWLARRARGEPVAYLLGRAGFIDFELEISPEVLIPRPETELLVQLALDTLSECRTPQPRIADLGTGSGAIAIALARGNSRCKVLGTDVCQLALALAKRNAAKLAACNLRFQNSYWCKALPQDSFDLIVANPPYVARGDPALHPDCAFEPELALFAGADGLAAIRQIADQAHYCLKPGGWLLLEHGATQREAVARSLTAHGYHSLDCRKDYAGHDRLIRARHGRLLR